jgi:hypothetical protein
MQEQEYAQKREGSTFADKLPYLGEDLDSGRVAQSQADNVSVYELESQNLIDKIKHMFLGEVYNPLNGLWEIAPHLAPPMNEKGAHFFTLKFGGHLDKNIMLSLFTLEEINQMMLEICADINEIFFKRAEEFEIKQENMSFIKRILEHEIRATYKRALNGGERTHRETLIKQEMRVVDTQTSSHVGTSSGGGIFGMFGNNKNRGGE